MYVSEAVRIQREGGLARLAIAYQRREMHVFEAVCRPDMVLTLAGSSRLAGTYHGYGAFSAYLDALRDVLSSAERQITFEHAGNDMVFWQATILMGPRHHVEMTLRVTVRYHHHDGRIESFLVEPEDQALFDHIVNSAVPARSEAL
jgi:ketosteroid isomerase-like protein